MTTDPRPEDELQLSDYVLIMRRRWTWIALTVVSIMVAAVLLTIARGPRFSATAQVGLGDSAAQEAIRSNSFTNVGAASRELSNEVNLALSDAVTSEVENQLGLEPTINIIKKTVPLPVEGAELFPDNRPIVRPSKGERFGLLP
ncbi:MAG: hypothetical protein GY773_17270, partial [Actinomycetia bacterium]|nr:hypothetical protein [Actinomycetes bacterium]